MTINVNSDGTINLIEGSTDIGGTRASIAMQAAEVLGIPAESVNPSVVDTNSVGYTAVTGGSRTTYATGYAAYEAAQEVKQKMIARAAKLWEVDEANVQFADGEFSCINGKEEQISFRDLCAQLGQTGGPVVGSGTVNPGGAGGAYATHVVDVAVDEETGKVEILRYTAVQDAEEPSIPVTLKGKYRVVLFRASGGH